MNVNNSFYSIKDIYITWYILDVVKYLLKSKNDSTSVNIANKNGRTCLHIAAIVNNLPLCKLLIDNGADKNAKMSHKVSILFTLDFTVVGVVIQGQIDMDAYILASGGVRPGC